MCGYDESGMDEEDDRARCTSQPNIFISALHQIMVILLLYPFL